MFIAKNNDLIILVRDTEAELLEALKFIVHTTIEETNINYQLYNGEYLTPEEIAVKERERIQELKMTKSDFFDATIKAFMATEHILQPVIETALNNLPIDETTKLIAINNFENAQNFYRKHTLFTLLSDIPLTIGEIEVTITAEQWDKFFDETDKKNPDAYKALLPKEVTGDVVE